MGAECVRPSAAADYIECVTWKCDISPETLRIDRVAFSQKQSELGEVGLESVKVEAISTDDTHIHKQTHDATFVGGGCLLRNDY